MNKTRPQEFEIKVPASIANLGPGFDTLAVAVQLYLRVKARVMPGHGQIDFHFEGQGLSGENYIERAYRYLAGQRSDELPSLSIEVHSDIPMGAGLGSSAAATVAGLRLCEAITGPISTQAMLNAACELEGHPDNACAALLGGLSASCQLPDGSVRAATFSWPASVRFVVITPDQPLGTKQSRAALPISVPLHDAVYNLQRVTLLLHSLQAQNFAMLKHALSDRLHQPARQSVVPGLKEALTLQHRDLLGVCLSGSGPSVVALTDRNPAAIAELLTAVYKRLGIAHSVRILDAHDANREPSSRSRQRKNRVAGTAQSNLALRQIDSGCQTDPLGDSAGTWRLRVEAG
jgi:homoserine kinase